MYTYSWDQFEMYRHKRPQIIWSYMRALSEHQTIEEKTGYIN